MCKKIALTSFILVTMLGQNRNVYKYREERFLTKQNYSYHSSLWINY